MLGYDTVSLGRRTGKPSSHAYKGNEAVDVWPVRTDGGSVVAVIQVFDGSKARKDRKPLR